MIRTTRHACHALFPCLLVLAAGCLYGGLSWSPDGKWLAFVTESEPRARLLADGWWARGGEDPVRTPGDGAGTQTLWICQSATGLCWKLSADRASLSSPAWSPDGTELAYTRRTDLPNGRARYEVVLQRGFKECVVLLSRELEAGGGRGAAALPRQEAAASASLAMPAWSPRGTFLAVPWLEPLGTAVLRVADRSLVATYPDACLPSWAPDEQRLALVQAGDQEGYYLAQPNFGAMLPAVATHNAVQPAVWDPSGESFYAVEWRQDPQGAGTLHIAELVAFDLKTGAVRSIRRIGSDRVPPGREPGGVYLAAVPGTRQVVAVVSGESRPTQVVVMDLDPTTPPRYVALPDPALGAGAPAASRDAHTLALRYGLPHALGVPALLDLRTGVFRTILPDRATQRLAAQSVIAAILHLLDGAPAGTAGTAVRYVWLPTPGEMKSLALRDGRAADRVERLGRLGLELLAEELAPDLHEPPDRAILEARMFLASVAGNYAAALDAARALEPLLQSPDERVALGVVRAGCYVALGRRIEARELLDLLGRKAAGEPPGQRPSPLAPPLRNPDDRSASAADPLRATITRLRDELAQSPE